MWRVSENADEHADEIPFLPAVEIIDVPTLSAELAGSKEESEELKGEAQAIPSQNHCSS